MIYGIIVTILLMISLYINYNLLRKTEKQEEYLDEIEQTLLGYDAFVINLYQKVKNGLAAARTADTLGSFESDDETGYVFKELKDIVGQLNGDFE
jgi:hypothetical protein